MTDRTPTEKNFGEKWTKLEKVFVTILMISLCVFVVEFLQPLYTNENPYCDNADCIEAAAEILKFVDTSVDPCDDFYNFACGTFAKNAFVNEAPSPVKVLYKKAKYQLAEIIMEEENPQDVNSMKLIKKLYKSCMDVDAIEEDNSGALLAVVERLGGFPVIEQASWKEEDFEWLRYEAKARRNGVDHDVFFQIFQHYDEENETFAAEIKVPSDYRAPLIVELKDDYVNFMADIVVFLGAPRYQAFNEMRKVMHFEDQLRKAVEIAENATDKVDFATTSIEELQNRLPRIPWLDYLNSITHPGYIFKENDTVVFSDYEYVRQLLVVIARTPKRTQANYAIWRSIRPFLIYLKKDIVDRSRNFTLLNRPVRESDDLERYKFCTHQATRIVQWAAEAAYARKYMTKTKIEDITEMVDNIMGEFEIAIENAQWFDQETRKSALERLHSMKNLIGCPIEMLNGTEFDKKLNYDKVTLNTTNLIEIVTILCKHLYDHIYSKIYTNETGSITNSLATEIVVINAYYLPTRNAMFLPAATLQGMFYNENLPKYFNYGAIGSIIGHEITHGFSMKPGKFGKTSKDEEWWSNSTQEAYLEKIQCLIDDYGNFTTTQVDFELNGTVTVEENFADYIGVKVAYRAYIKSLKKTPELPLPGLDLTPNQLFWITTAAYECYKGGSHEKSIFKETDLHSIPHFRIISPVRNTYYFGEDFNCPLGSYMNPLEKCEVL